MAMHISKELLYRLRNEVEIRELIEGVLGLPAKWSEGQFRFLCPVCGEFNTATNPRTNLGRCFRCKKNYNPIDFVIISERYSFLEAVDFLKPLLLRKPRNGAAG